MNDDFVIIKNILVRYKGTDPFVEIPDGVTCIGKRAFYYQDIQTVDMPETVTVIDDEAFCNCERLCEINFPDGLVKIGNSAFSGCEKIEAIDLPEGLQSIGNKAFYDCWSLKSVHLPKTINNIGSSAFKSSGIENIIIPEGVEKLSDSVFETCSQLKHVILPRGLKTIGYRAFYHCNELTDVVFPEGMCDIGNEAFAKCKRLIDDNGFIIINNNVSYYFGNDRVIEIPEGVKRINSFVFYQNHQIVKVVLPERLVSIDYCAFAGCVNLRDINITASVTDIDHNAFVGCSKLADENGFVIFKKVLFDYCGNSSEVTVPEKVEIIGKSSFRGNKIVEKVIIPETVDIIEEEAFYGCRNLKQIVMPKRMRRIGNGAFGGCTKLERITIPEGIEVLEYNLFDFCHKLVEITLPASLKSFKYGAINYCDSLEIIDIPLGVENIGDGQFENCGELKQINIPESVVSFGNCNCDLQGVQLNVSKLGRQFKIVLRHRWDSDDEKKLWEMFNNPSIDLFDSIKTGSYKIALAERLYPEYKDYGAYLKKNYRKAIKDAIDFEDFDLLEELKSTDLFERDKVESCIKELQRKKTENDGKTLNDIKHALSDESIDDIYDLMQIMSELESLSKYKDTDKLIKQCADKIEILEDEIKERDYEEAVNKMNEYGGMTRMALESAIEMFSELRTYKDSEDLLTECRLRLKRISERDRANAYQKALSLFNSYDGSSSETLDEAIEIFEEIEGYKDSGEILRDFYKKHYNFDIYEGRTLS